jgi:hypothetical protein
MQNSTYIPQTSIYTIFNENNPLYSIARSNPENMCWLTTLLYALQELGFANDKKIHRKLTSLLNSSLGLMFVDKENGALSFPKKYELTDGYIKDNLNRIFSTASLKLKVIRVLSDIKFDEIALIEKYLNQDKKLISIVKNKELDIKTGTALTQSVSNHAILITSLVNNNNGIISVKYIDPSDGYLHSLHIGVNIFMQWIQYIWVIERKLNIFDRVFGV